MLADIWGEFSSSFSDGQGRKRKHPSGSSKRHSFGKINFSFKGELIIK